MIFRPGCASNQRPFVPRPKFESLAELNPSLTKVDTVLCSCAGRLDSSLGPRQTGGMADEEYKKVEHLKLVQNIIARMAGNSAQMKTWTVSLVTATIVFSGLSDDPHWLIGLGGFVPIFALWTMDARYLHLERCYIKLYEAIAVGASVTLFDLEYRVYASAVTSVWRIAWSWSVFTFYGSLSVVMSALLIILAR